MWHMGKLGATLGLLKNQEDVGGKKKLLDVGCASGWLVSQISSRYPDLECFGVDVYKRAIEYGKKTYPQISFSHADAHRLPFEKNYFDVVICTEVLEHVVDPQKIMKEIKRVVKPSGIVIISMDSGNLLFGLVWTIWKKFNGKIWQEAHLHKFTPKRLDELFEKTGFKIEKRKFFNLRMALAYLLRK